MDYENWTREDLLVELRFLQRRLAELGNDRSEPKNEIPSYNSELEYRTIFETTGTAMIIYGDDMTIFLANSEFEKLSGYSKEEVESKKKWTEFVSEIDLSRMIDCHQLRSCLPQNILPNKYEFHFINREGNLRDIVLSIALVPGSTNRVVSFTDITELNQMVKKVKQSEEKYRSLFNSMHEGLVLLHMAELSSGNWECRYLDVNPAYEAMMGVSKGVVVGKNIFEVFPGLEKQWIEKCIDAGHEGKTKQGLRYISELNQYLEETFFNIGENQCAVLSIDVTERILGEEALRLSQKSFQKAFNSSSNLMCTFSIDEDRFIDFNNTFCQVTGYTREELRNLDRKEFKLLISPKTQRKIEKMIINEGLIRNLEIKFYLKSKQERTGLLSADRYKINGQKRIILSLTDITELKKLENEMIRYGQLELIGELAASLGHEVRNPMTSVRGFLQLLKETDSSSSQNDYFDIMIEELDRANTIITEFLSLAKNKKVDLKRDNLNRIIESLYPLIMAQAVSQEKHIELAMGEIPELFIDQKEIRQLILNLVQNGLEAMDKGKILTIKTYVEDGKPVLLIRDQGTGIAPEIIEKVGTPFFTTKDYGTGLGLSVCYSIASRHNASIRLDSSSEGTDICICFA